MTLEQAIGAAKRLRKQYKDDVAYVFYEDGEYHAAREQEADTFWIGQDPIAAVLPGGEVAYR